MLLVALARQKSLEILMLEHCDVSEAQKEQIMEAVKLLNAPKSEVVFSQEDVRIVKRPEPEERPSKLTQTDDLEEKLFVTEKPSADEKPSVKQPSSELER